jgi:glutaminyl-peptide cyclotransferase
MPFAKSPKMKTAAESPAPRQPKPPRSFAGRTSLVVSLLGISVGALVWLASCDEDSPSRAPRDVTAAPGTLPAVGTPAATDTVTNYTYEIVNTYLHDPGAFTQGLVFLDGALFESTGLNGQSSLRKVDLASGEVLKKVEVPAEYFAEGLTVLGDHAYQLTWQSHKGFVYNRESFEKEKEFSYDGEGWGLATDGKSLILSDGTDQIRFLDPATFAVTRTIDVRFKGRPVTQLNELEYVKGEIFANVWQTDFVVRIDPASGLVTGVIDFTGLLPPQDHRINTDVLNGIAYDPATDRLFVTGKLWPKLFEVRLKAK